MYPFGIPGIGARRLPAGGGISLRVIESGPVDGTPVVLVHGWGASVYSFAETIPALAAAGYRVVAIDLPGHGLSDKPRDESAYTRGALGDAVLAVVAALGIERFIGIGHSMGGGILLDLALRGTPSMQALGLVNAVGLGTPRAMALIRLMSPRLVNRVTPMLLTRWLVEQILRVAFATPGRPTPRDIDEYWAPTQFAEFAAACRACVHRFAWSGLSHDALRSLTIPVLVVSGPRDHVVRDGTARAAHIPGARIAVIPGAGHIVQQECADQTNAELLAFLGAL